MEFITSGSVHSNETVKIRVRQHILTWDNCTHPTPNAHLLIDKAKANEFPLYMYALD